MSVTMQHTVWCDICSHWIQHTGPTRRVLAIAKAEGWQRTHAGGVVRDLCPNCFKQETKT